MGDVIIDADREGMLRLLFLQVFIDCEQLLRCCVLRPQAIAAADDHRTVKLIVEGSHDIQKERFADGAGFFRAVKYRNPFYSIR
ncbi:hypothetical protein SDC9_106992 [bioreactor metagenome]|uniref:Uncharacterized protein n=1 Tax=bioreactor metagenome TaxID=1076179 RepID=A0A645B3Z7_9ZZZZ